MRSVMVLRVIADVLPATVIAREPTWDKPRLPAIGQMAAG
jgi:hypothetical protein